VSGGGYRDEREAMAAQVESLRGDNEALRGQVASLEHAQRENEELRRRLANAGLAPPRRSNRSAVVFALVGLIVAAAGACGMMFVTRSASPVPPPTPTQAP
jgi:hypothetical protein